MTGQLSVDADVKAVLEFMERNVPANKLVRVAAAAASLAPILWSELVPLERTPVLSLSPESSHGQQSIATQSCLGRGCAHGDPAEVADNRQLT